MTWLEHSLSIGGWMLEVELRWLYDHAQLRELVVEIGIWQGRSTSALCAGCPGTVIAIDTFEGDYFTGPLWEDNEAVTKTNLAKYISSGKLIIHKMTSAEYFEQLISINEEPFIDMLFIDGSHDFKSVTQDLKLSKFVKPGGLICGHDWSQPTVVSALKKLETAVVPDTDIWMVAV
jgi:predicted O-methyltransferase YrrM